MIFRNYFEFQKTHLSLMLSCIMLLSCAGKKISSTPVDLSMWRAPTQNDVQGISGLWYGTQKCTRYLGLPLDVLIGIRPLSGNQHEVLTAAAHQSYKGVLSSMRQTVTLDAAGSGQAFKTNKNDSFALRYVRLEGVNTNGDLSALVLDYDASDKRRIDECKVATLSRLVDPSRSPLLKGWNLQSPAVFAQQRQLYGLRDDLAGQWQGLANCKRNALPVDFTLTKDPAIGWVADLLLDGSRERYRMIPRPTYSRSDYYHFEPLGERSNARIIALAEGSIDKHGRAVWLKLSFNGGCKDNLLYRHWRLPELSGEYASATNLANFCQTVSQHWFKNAKSTQTDSGRIVQLLADTPWRYQAEQSSRWEVINGDNFLKTFGVPLNEISTETFTALTSQLASCGALAAQESNREDFQAGLFSPGALRSFNPKRREYELYTSQQLLGKSHQRSISRSADELLEQAFGATTLTSLDAEMQRVAPDLVKVNPSSLYPLLNKLIDHRLTLQAQGVAQDRERIRQQGPPEINTTSLNTAVHHFLKNSSLTADRVASAVLKLPQGFSYSCGAKDYCTAIGGIVKYRYYIASLIGCSYERKTRATCSYRMGLDVQSTLSSSSGWRNNLLASQGATMMATTLQSGLEYRDWEWVIVDGIMPK